MENLEKSYCRLCAEQKQCNKLFDLEKDSEKCLEINKKLQILNAVFVDVTSHNMLPRTVCFICWDSLNKASEFIHKLKQAQSILNSIFPMKVGSNLEASEDDSAPVFEDLYSPCPKTDEDEVQIKEENLPLLQLKQKVGSEQAQSILNSIFPMKVGSNLEASEDDSAPVFDDLYSPCPKTDEDQVQIKEENLPLLQLKQNMGSTALYKRDTPESSKTAVVPVYPVKVEVKEESNDISRIEDYNPQESNENYDSSMNVQVFLDSAIGDLPLTQNLTLYAKEVPIRTKKSIKKWKAYPWICGHCNNEFPDINMLKIHSREVHKCCATFMCIDCDDESRCYDFEIFVNHVRKHRKSLRNVCYYCDIKTENLIDHVQTHFTKSQQPCHVCGDILKNASALQNHTKQYNIHEKRKPRRKRGTPITTEDLTCKLCKKVYKNLNSLRDHTKLHTSDRKRNYTCDRCGKTFYNKGTLTTHIMSHDKIRPHICRICKKSFLFPNMLRRHVEMHSGIKPYSCEQCGRCFRLQYQLNAHKIIHTDSLPYVCQYCSKAFRFKQILQNHERQHTGAKPYSCQICSMEFTNWSNYNKHMKRRHNTDTSKKKITPEGVFPINPETGLMIRIEDPVGTEEWKNAIMIPVKRGKKKAIKQEVSKS